MLVWAYFDAKVMESKGESFLTAPFSNLLQTWESGDLRARCGAFVVLFRQVRGVFLFHPQMLVDDSAKVKRLSLFVFVVSEWGAPSLSLEIHQSLASSYVRVCVQLSLE